MINQNSNKFFAINEKHPFHLVNPSLLPVITGFSAMSFVIGLIFYWHPFTPTDLLSGDALWLKCAFYIFLNVLFAWFIQVVIESGLNYHSARVKKGFRYGMALFIVSEIMFFFAFFWAVFHFSLSPSVAIGTVWPPAGVQPMEIWGLPLVNTILLLLSGVTITLAHHSILQNETYTSQHNFKKHLIVTIILGITFLICQGIEYKYGLTIKWEENVYGSTFFVTTGFHGFHVTVGTIFLLFCLVWNNLTWTSLHNNSSDNLTSSFWKNDKTNVSKNEFVKTLPFKAMLAKTNFFETVEYLFENMPEYRFTQKHHFGFEAAAWYWHFVDVVWLFLFISIYWWGSA